MAIQFTHLLKISDYNDEFYGKKTINKLRKSVTDVSKVPQHKRKG